MAEFITGGGSKKGLFKPPFSPMNVCMRECEVEKGGLM